MLRYISRLWLSKGNSALEISRNFLKVWFWIAIVCATNVTKIWEQFSRIFIRWNVGNSKNEIWTLKQTICRILRTDPNRQPITTSLVWGQGLPFRTLFVLPPTRNGRIFVKTCVDVQATGHVCWQPLAGNERGGKGERGRRVDRGKTERGGRRERER